MKSRLLLTGILFLSWATPSKAWGAQSNRGDLVAAFDSANATYERGDFRVALEQYEALLQTHRHFETEFNAGNAAFKLGEFGKARLHYERASLLDPSNPNLTANLALLKSKIVDRITPVPQLGLTHWLSSWVGPSRLFHWAMWTLFWWSAAWVLWAMRWKKDNRDSRATLVFLGSASLALGLIGLWGTRQCNLQTLKPSQLVILADRIDVLSTPSSGGTVLFQLHEGACASILNRTAGWAEIQLENGNVGWVANEVTEDV